MPTLRRVADRPQTCSRARSRIGVLICAIAAAALTGCQSGPSANTHKTNGNQTADWDKSRPFPIDMSATVDSKPIQLGFTVGKRTEYAYIDNPIGKTVSGRISTWGIKGVSLTEGWGVAWEALWIHLIPKRVSLGPRAGLLTYVAEQTLAHTRVYLHAAVADASAPPVPSDQPGNADAYMWIVADDDAMNRVPLVNQEYVDITTDPTTNRTVLTVHPYSNLSPGELTALNDLFQRVQSVRVH